MSDLNPRTFERTGTNPMTATTILGVRAGHGASRARPGSGAATVLLALVLAGAARADRGIDGELTALAADNPAVVAAGEALYAVHCASCHGAELEGQPNWRERDANGLLPAPPHDATGHTWHHADDLLFEITKYGPARVIDDPDYRSAMPAYEGVLDDEEIVAALSYIVSRWPPKEREWQRDVNRTRLELSGETDPDAPAGAGTGGGSGGSLLERLFR